MKNSSQIFYKLKKSIIDFEGIKVFSDKEILEVNFYIVSNKPYIEVSTIYGRSYNFALVNYFTFERMKNFALKNQMKIKHFAIWNNGKIEKYNFEKNIFEF